MIEFSHRAIVGSFPPSPVHSASTEKLLPCGLETTACHTYISACHTRHIVCSDKDEYQSSSDVHRERERQLNLMFVCVQNPRNMSPVAMSPCLSFSAYPFAARSDEDERGGSCYFGELILKDKRIDAFPPSQSPAFDFFERRESEANVRNGVFITTCAFPRFARFFFFSQNWLNIDPEE